MAQTKRELFGGTEEDQKITMIFYTSKVGGEKVGEFTESEFHREIFSNELHPKDFYWSEGMGTGRWFPPITSDKKRS